MCWKDWKSLRRPHFPLHLRRATRAGTSSTIMMHLHHVDDVARIGYRHLILQLQYYKAWQLMTVRLQRQSRPKQDLATAHALQDRWPAGYCSGYLFRRPPGSAGVPWHVTWSSVITTGAQDCHFQSPNRCHQWTHPTHHPAISCLHLSAVLLVDLLCACKPAGIEQQETQLVWLQRPPRWMRNYLE